MGGHGIDNTMEVEVAVCELLRMQDPDLYCLATFKSCQDRANVSLCPRIVLKNIGTQEELMNGIGRTVTSHLTFTTEGTLFTEQSSQYRYAQFEIKLSWPVLRC